MSDMVAPSLFTVMCIDDNVMLVDALERRLALEPGFGRFYRVDAFVNAADAVAEAQPDVVLLDIDLPGGVDAVELLAELVQRTPQSRVIVFTGHPQGELVSRTMGLGAWGFVSKGIPSDRLIDAIRHVAGGEAVIELED
ncbi:MAG: response regulator transcription factor [Cytophagaceae bacterium]|nr:response regulator transcription factor [Gemmatimonadaceae bacterium]